MTPSPKRRCHPTLLACLRLALWALQTASMALTRWLAKMAPMTKVARFSGTIGGEANPVKLGAALWRIPAPVVGLHITIVFIKIALAQLGGIVLLDVREIADIDVIGIAFAVRVHTGVSGGIALILLAAPVRIGQKSGVPQPQANFRAKKDLRFLPGANIAFSQPRQQQGEQKSLALGLGRDHGSRRRLGGAG